MAVRGWTTLTAWGLGREAFAGALTGRTAPPVAAMEIRGMPDASAFPYLQADLSAAKDYFAPRALRRVDAFGKIALLLAAALLRDRSPEEREAMGLIVATGFGSFSTNMEFLNTALEGGHGAASPMVFSSTVHNSAMAAAAIQFGIRGPSLTVSMFDHSVPGALMLADLWLTRRACPEVLLIAADDVPSLSAYCRARTGDAPDPQRPGTLSAEGGAAFLFGPGDGPVLGRSEARADATYRSAEPGTNAHAYGRTYMAPAFELAAACHDLGNAAAAGCSIALEFPGQPRWLLKRSP
jgi:3-oxoacyl-[acyl-carrier-protein] synthase II